MPAPLFHTIEERFNSLVTKTNGCWICALTNDNGYGRFAFKGKRYYAHRVSWEMHKGPIPEDKNVLHSCDNPPCANPEHLFLGDDYDNSQDKVTKSRQYRPIGELSNRAILKEDDVYEIRFLLERGASHRAIAEDFGVTKSTITRISNGSGWSHLL